MSLAKDAYNDEVRPVIRKLLKKIVVIDEADVLVSEGKGCQEAFIRLFKSGTPKGVTYCLRLH